VIVADEPMTSDDSKPLSVLAVLTLVALFLAPILYRVHHDWRVGALAFVPPVLLGAITVLVGRRKLVGAPMNSFRYRLIDTAGGEIGIIDDPRPRIELGERVRLPDGSTGTVVDIYDDEDGKDGGVEATLAVEE
jgi:hypothetical protein